MKVIILGAGVAGLSTAIAMTMKGFDVEVHEKGKTISEQGAGIVCWPNASFVLDQLELLSGIREVSGRPEAMRRLSQTGELLGELDIATLNNIMGYPSYSILRKDLMNSLYQRSLSLKIKILFGQKILSIEDMSESQACLKLTNGATMTADIIIAADGRMNSVARLYVNGSNQPVYQEFINWIGKIESANFKFTDSVIRDYWGIGERFGVVPIGENKAYWAAAMSNIERKEMDSSNDHADLLSRFANWPSPVMEILASTPPQDVHKIFVHDHDPIEKWHRKNVIIIGDAAHAPLPTSGQGACQALEDAWHLSNVLARELGERIDLENLDSIYRRFTSQRYKKTTQVIQSARSFAKSLFNTDPIFCEQRNQKSQSTDYHDVLIGMSKFWGDGLPLRL